MNKQLLSISISINFLTVIILLSILFNSIRRFTVYNKEYKIYIYMILINIFLSIFEPLTLYLDGLVYENARLVALIINSLLYGYCASFSYLWLIFSYYRINSNPKKLKDKNFILKSAIPLLIDYVLIIINFFTPVMFKIDPNTLLYSRKWGFIFTYLLTYSYLIFGAVYVIIYRTKINKYLLGSVIGFIVPVFISSLIQAFMYGISTIWVGASIGLLNIFITLQDEKALIDPLSGVYSRQFLFNYIKNYYPNKFEGFMVGIMIDLDEFKSINDNFGHHMGDEAIKDIGTILRSVCTSEMIAARFGGDEFVIIAHIKNKNELIDITNSLFATTTKFQKENSTPYKFIYSIGYSVYQKDDTLDSFINRMDANMYKQKEIHKNSQKKQFTN